MLLPRAESGEHAAAFAADGVLDLGAARLERSGKAVYLTARNPRFLNAEDDTTLDAMETAVDVAILDPATEIAVLRGGKVEHPKYRGPARLRRRHQPHASLSRQDSVSLVPPARPRLRAQDPARRRATRLVARRRARRRHREAVGRGGRYVCDRRPLPASAGHGLRARRRRRLHDAAGPQGRDHSRVSPTCGCRASPATASPARRSKYGRRLDCDSPEGRMICDEIVPPSEMDAAIERVVAGLTNAGAVSAVGNRRAFRVGQEPLDLFRRYCRRLCARAGVLPLQPGAHRQSRAQLGRGESQGVARRDAGARAADVRSAMGVGLEAKNVQRVAGRDRDSLAAAYGKADRCGVDIAAEVHAPQLPP